MDGKKILPTYESVNQESNEKCVKIMHSRTEEFKVFLNDLDSAEICYQPHWACPLVVLRFKDKQVESIPLYEGTVFIQSKPNYRTVR